MKIPKTSYSVHSRQLCGSQLPFAIARQRPQPAAAGQPTAFAILCGDGQSQITMYPLTVTLRQRSALTRGDRQRSGVRLHRLRRAALLARMSRQLAEIGWPSDRIDCVGPLRWHVCHDERQCGPCLSTSPDRAPRLHRPPPA